MLLKNLGVFVLAAMLVACTGTPKNTAAASKTHTHSFGIYYIDIGPGTLDDLASLPLEKEPVISDADILGYDFAHHEMTLTQAAMRRLPYPPLEGVPFVLVADGQRIYLGAFVTPLSSRSISVPSIMVGHGEDINSITIEKGYPPGFGVGPDLRSDPRIRRALSALHKLR